MKHFVVLALIALVGFNAQSQTLESNLDELNRKIDQAVCDKDIAFLKKHYADDFVFTHFTGLIDSKESWISNIEKMGNDKFLARQHDSTKVEMHDDVAIVFGKLTVTRQGKDKVSKYALRYVRVFTLRKRVWQMISHKSTAEVDI